jgi:hypothetical protein
VSELQRLIRVAARRNSAEEYTVVRFRALRSLVDRFRRKAVEEGVSGNVVLEAFLRGYVESHPAVLAAVDQWTRESYPEQEHARGPVMNRRDLDEIYAAANRGMMAEEESDG